MKGYLNNEKATREMVDEDGWLHTGVSYFGNINGYSFITENIKRVVAFVFVVLK